MRIEMLIIDPQNDFCSDGTQYGLKKGSLYVPGANQDMDRLANMCISMENRIFDYHVTLDTHHYIDIAHPCFWVNSKGEHPDPIFTTITPEDMEKGTWRTFNPLFQKRAYEYVQALRTNGNGRYALTIWPYHCLIGTPGHNVYPTLAGALLKWEQNFAMVDYVTKGSNYWTEHYSAVQADVPDPEDPGTLLNTNLIEPLEEADVIGVAGEALQFCMKFTLEDIINNFGKDNIKKLVLLMDATSPVPTPDAKQVTEQFLKILTGQGMRLSNTVDFAKLN